MTRVYSVAALVLALVGLVALVDTVVAKSGANWIQLKYIGEQTKSVPAVWLATEPIPMERFSRGEAIVLSAKQYERVTVFVNHYDCVDRRIMDGTPSFTVQLSQSIDGQENAPCLLTREKACDFLAQLLTLPFGVGDSRPIAIFGINAGCKGPAFDIP